MTTMRELTQTLKPVRTCGFFDLCSAYLKEIQEAERNGETHYEISGQNTKSGHPVVIEFYGE